MKALKIILIAYCLFILSGCSPPEEDVKGDSKYYLYTNYGMRRHSLGQMDQLIEQLKQINLNLKNIKGKSNE